MDDEPAATLLWKSHGVKPQERETRRTRSREGAKKEKERDFVNRTVEDYWAGKNVKR